MIHDTIPISIQDKQKSGFQTAREIIRGPNEKKNPDISNWQK